jgi:hypothetical protein
MIIIQNIIMVEEEAQKGVFTRPFQFIKHDLVQQDDNILNRSMIVN